MTWNPPPARLRQVLAPSLKDMNGLEILLQYGGLAANVCFKEVLRCMLATQVYWNGLLVLPSTIYLILEVPVTPSQLDNRTPHPYCGVILFSSGCLKDAEIMRGRTFFPPQH